MTTVEKKIIEYFEENDDVFTTMIESLNSWNGWLNDDEIYPMEMIDEIYSKPSEAMARAYYGYDAENYTTDADGTKHYGEFNPNRDYFYFNGYGNLVSCDHIDYSDYLTVETIREMQNEYIHIMQDAPGELDDLFDELEKEDNPEELEEEEEEEEETEE